MSVVQLQPRGLDGNYIQPGFTVQNIGEVRLSSQRITVDYTRWNAPSTFQILELIELPPHSKLLDLVADTTTAYAGPGGTLELRMGSIDNGAPGTEDFLLHHDIKTGPVVKGVVEADLGSNLAAMVPDPNNNGNLMPNPKKAQGTFTPNWGSVSSLYVALNSSSGNLNTLTAGSTTFYITYLRYP